tara:strand:+ start:13409 stop:14929 length:1521 start_codon:yes stop_codon:yes gene_type:complete
MNFLLDRFPVKTFNDLKIALEDLGHEVPLSVLKEKLDSVDNSFNVNYFIDRDVARGVVTKNVPMVLTRDEIEQASKYEGLVINLFARFDTTQGKFSSQEMSSHYYELYNFWIYQIKTCKIDFCFHNHVPHDPSSLILYLALKNKKIPTVFFDVPYIFNKFKMLSCSFRHRSLLLENKNDKSKFNFFDEFNEYQQNLVNKGINSVPIGVRFRGEKKTDNTLKYRIKKISKLIMSNPSVLISKIWNYCFGSQDIFFKISRDSWSSKKNNMTRIHFYFFKQRLKLSLFFKYYRYEAKCIKNIKNEYIYFPMPSQPEATTLPLALEFRDITLVLRIIRQAIPIEIPIIVKENLSVFETRNPYLSGVNYRSADFYEQLLKIQNLRFVSTKENSHELIKNAKLIASINGTAVIEAVTLGKPAISFGSNWHDNINGIHKFESINKLQEFYKNIRSDSTFIKPENSKIKFDEDIMIKIGKHNTYRDNDYRKQLVKSFINSIYKFEEIDDRKWDV